jgi:hypothetical protein
MKSIISASFEGQRLIAVGNNVFWSERWKTFPDFLCDYIKDRFGASWWTEQFKVPPKKRSQVTKWASQVYQY